MNFIQLSIIIPFYNVEDYLHECLMSILSGNLLNIEIILIDDGSTDDSYFIAKELERKYPNLRLYSKNQGGNSAARNWGFELATGKYVMFVDSDDIIHPAVISEMIGNAEINGADIVVADFYEFEDGSTARKIRTDKSLFSQDLVTEEERLDKLFTIDISFSIWNKVYKTAFLRKNKLELEKYFWGEDVAYVFKAFYKATLITKVNGIVYGYRQRQGSLMKNVSIKLLDKLVAMENLVQFLKSEKKFLKYEDQLNMLYLKMAFSIFYFVFKNNGDQVNSLKILTQLRLNERFSRLINTKFPLFSKLRKYEKILFLMFRLKIINTLTIKAILSLT